MGAGSFMMGLGRGASLCFCTRQRVEHVFARPALWLTSLPQMQKRREREIGLCEEPGEAGVASAMGTPPAGRDDATRPKLFEGRAVTARPCTVHDVRGRSAL